MIALTRRYRFPAAHVLASPELDDASNQAIFGACANPRGHGHNYGVDVTVTGPVGEDGRIVDPDLLDAIFEEEVAGPYSHHMLNDVAPFGALVPTAENIARAIHDRLAVPIAVRTGARLARVLIDETRRNSVTCGSLR